MCIRTYGNRWTLLTALALITPVFDYTKLIFFVINVIYRVFKKEVTQIWSPVTTKVYNPKQSNKSHFKVQVFSNDIQVHAYHDLE